MRALRCPRRVAGIHPWLGVAVIAVCAVAAFTGGYLYWRGRGAGRVTTHLLSLAQTLLVAQVAIGLLLVILTPLFFFKPLFLVILVAAAGLGIWEMTRALRTSGARPPLIPLLGGGVAMVCLAWCSGVDARSVSASG